MATSSCTAENAGINFDITNERIRAVFNYANSYGAHDKLPDHKMYCVSKV